MSTGLKSLAVILLPLLTAVTSALAAQALTRHQHGFLLWMLCAVSVLGIVSCIAGGASLLFRQQRFAQELMALRHEAADQAYSVAESKRMAMLGSLAAGLAHELGQPLSAARVGIEGIHYLRQLGRNPGPEHIERTLSRVGMSILAMTQTIEHLRGLATPTTSANLSELDLGTCVEAILAERDQWLKYSDTRIAWQKPELPVSALGDPAGIRLILTNLLRNAVEAVAGQSEERRLVRIAVGPGPVISVHDSGAGIGSENLTHLFDPFFSTKGGSARGVGLSLAKASAQRMGADLSVASNLGSGTSFTLRLLANSERA